MLKFGAPSAVTDLISPLWHFIQNEKNKLCYDARGFSSAAGPAGTLGSPSILTLQ